MKLHTKDLILRTVSEKDIDEISRMWEYPNEISKQKAYKALEYINRTHKQNRKKSICHLCLAVCVKDATDTIVGWCGLDGEVEREKTVLFYIIDENYRNKGYATQCAKALLKYAFEDMEYDVIYGGCDKENFASYRVMQKIGMEQVTYYDNGDPIFVMYRERYFRNQKG